MENKESYYMVIPAKVWDTDLNPKAILCYGHITVLANKRGYCFATNAYFQKVLNVSDTTLGRYLNQLEKLDLIERELIYKKGSKEVLERKIYLGKRKKTDEDGPTHTDEDGPMHTGDDRPMHTGEQDNTTSTNSTSTKVTDASRQTRIENLYWKKLVPAYPTNRLGNRQHGLKKWLQLEDKEMVLAIKNLNRYLNLAGSYVKVLQNYLDQRCFTEEWLNAESETKQKKNDNKTKKFNANYDNF